MGTAVIVIIVIVVIVAIIALVAMSAYNGFVKSRNLIQESWRQIDVELNRRYELIPNLVETVRAYAAHERNTLDDITRLRSQAQQLSQTEGSLPSQQRADVESQLSGAVRNLIVSVEAYPDLKSNVNFLELQKQLAETEDRIAAGRRFYNANVRVYNTKVESVPTNIIANMFHFEKATYFEVNDPTVRQAPDGELRRDRLPRRPAAGAAATAVEPPRRSTGVPPATRCRTLAVPASTAIPAPAAVSGPAALPAAVAPVTAEAGPVRAAAEEPGAGRLPSAAAEQPGWLPDAAATGADTPPSANPPSANPPQQGGTSRRESVGAPGRAESEWSGHSLV